MASNTSSAPTPPRHSSAKPVALVTGASQGIGKHFAEVLAENGFDLVLVARSRELLEDLARELKQKHLTNVRVFAKDLSLMNSIDEIDRELESEDVKIEVLVNNAGFGDAGSFTETSWQKEFRMIQLNVVALTYLTKIFAEKMKAAGHGRICNVASTAAFQPGPYMAVYFATKAYVLSFSQAVADELRGTGVSVTTLCPGATESAFHDVAQTRSSKLFRGKEMPTAETVARYGYHAMMQGKTVAVHGWMNRIGTEIVRFLPRRLVVRSVGSMMEPS